MAPPSVVHTSYRVASRLGASTLKSYALTRGFRAGSVNAAARNFKMPAMSPTMTEGNISSWKVKEGEKFSAGDVLIEVETDKAQMDVEAPEDGIMFKILVEGGAKNIPVGTRIAVLAEPRDDLATLEIPQEDKAAASPKEEKAKKQQESTSSSATTSRTETLNESSQSSHATETQHHHRPPKEPFTPSPSVAHLLHDNSLSKDDITNIPATGPRGRLLKGDVLAYIGSINKSAPKELESALGKLAKLDLSNIKIRQASPTATAPEQKADAAAAKASKAPIESDISIEISLSNFYKLQSELKQTLGFSPPLTTFLTLASQKASLNLPPSKLPPSLSELFNQLVNFNAPHRNPSSKPAYTPLFTPVPSSSPSSLLSSSSPLSTSTLGTTRLRPPTIDIYDVLTAGKSTPSSPPIRKVSTTTTTHSSQTIIVLTLKLHKDDEKRGMVFLMRVKELLEEKPKELFEAWGEGVKI